MQAPIRDTGRAECNTAKHLGVTEGSSCLGSVWFHVRKSLQFLLLLRGSDYFSTYLKGCSGAEMVLPVTGFAHVNNGINIRAMNYQARLVRGKTKPSYPILVDGHAFSQSFHSW